MYYLSHMKKALLALTLVFVLLEGCKKSSETLSYPAISDYAPLTVGKYITYSLDSTLYINFGVTKVVHSYEVKYVVDAEITDNNNEPAFRIIRYIRSTGEPNWASDATFMVKNTGNSLEFVENNMRFIKLKQPIRDGYSWKGNSYFDTQSQFSDFNYMDDWDYQYSDIGQSETIGSKYFDEVLTVTQRDETIGIPAEPEYYSEINYSIEKYAKGVGMVYKEFYHDEYQPPVTQGGSGYHVDGSYGIKLTVIDYN